MRKHKYWRDIPKVMIYHPCLKFVFFIMKIAMTLPIIKLDSNENPLGASPKAMQAAAEALTHTHRYHDGEYHYLKSALAEFLTVNTNQITIGNGSENILEMIIKAFCRDNGTAVIAQYAFITIPFLLQLHRVNTVIVPTINWQHNLNNVISAINETTRIIFLVNPSNPIGNYFNAEDFLKFIKCVPPHILVVVDEAYYEYIDQADFPNSIALLSTYSNLIIVRTFSKGYGLAGLRVGYAISAPDIAQQLNAVRLPYHVNSVAIHAAIAALDDQTHITYSTHFNKQGRNQLIAGLNTLQLPYLDSAGNFISISLSDAEKIYLQLKQKNIFVKPLTAYQLPNYIRVTIGTDEQIQAFLAAISTIL